MSTHNLSIEAGYARLFETLEPGPLARERVDIEAAIGRVLAAELRAQWPLPSAALSIMDGYAIASEALIAAREHGAETLALELGGHSSAGHPRLEPLTPGSCVRIATGAVVPPGADAVVPQEDTRRIEVGERVLIEFSADALADAAPKRWIRAPGSDVPADAPLLPAGSVITSGGASLLAASGHAEVEVARRPVVALLSSGDELVPIGQTPGPGQIIATNTMMLRAEIREAGGEPLTLGPIADTREAMLAALEQARESADLLVTTGGISVGDHDLVLPCLEQLGFELGFRKLSLRPGRPTTFGHLPRPERRKLPVLALPGNPASTLVTFELFARPTIRALLGMPRARWRPRLRRVELASPMRGEQRRTHLVRATFDDDGRVRPLATQVSGALRSIAAFELLVIVPAGRAEVDAGERLDALVIRE